MSIFEEKYRFCNAHLKNMEDRDSGEQRDLLYLSRGKDEKGMNLRSYKLVDPVIADDCVGKDLIKEDGTIPSDNIIVSFKVVDPTDDDFKTEPTCIEIPEGRAVITAVRRHYKKEDFSFKARMEEQQANSADHAQQTPDEDIPF